MSIQIKHEPVTDEEECEYQDGIWEPPVSSLYLT